MLDSLLQLGRRNTPGVVKRAYNRFRSVAHDPKTLRQLDWLCQAELTQRNWVSQSGPAPAPGHDVDAENPLAAFFRDRKDGRGIWKWTHYFEIYHRHLSRYRNREIHLVEIGIFSGGSLDMWRAYFGPKCHIYGVDIEPACKRYEENGTRVFVGDQADRDFWRRFREEVPVIDIVIDDGGHEPDQQAITLEELLPQMRPGGTYLCEDIHGCPNEFTSYIGGLIQGLNHVGKMDQDLVDPGRRLTSSASAFQAAIHSIHSYPFVTVIEKRDLPVMEFVAPKQGTLWAPHGG
jgi:hypothetical protein